MITKDLNVCLLPMSIKWDNIEANHSNLSQILNEVHPQTDLVIIPETFSTGFPVGKTREEILQLIESTNSQTIDILKKLSNKHNFAIAGSFICKSNDLLSNRAFFVEPNGDITYSDKKHLFTMAGEDKIFTAGEKKLKIRYRGWNIAMVICYDVRFPVWCRNINNEYDILIISANWPEVRISAWNKLLPARAIENESYICGVNCKGTDTKGFTYDGSSMIIDYKGNEIGKTITLDNNNSQDNNSQDNNSQDRNSQDLIYATLSRTKIDNFREKFPAWRDSDPFRLI